jgi:hypothetical protein
MPIDDALDEIKSEKVEQNNEEYIDLDLLFDRDIGKWDLYRLIVGKDPFKGQFPGDVPHFEIKSEDMDDVYIKVKKMQRCYAKEPKRSISKYFAESFALIEEAYLYGDIDQFNDAVRGLMIDIDSD